MFIVHLHLGIYSCKLIWKYFYDKEIKQLFTDLKIFLILFFEKS